MNFSTKINHHFYIVESDLDLKNELENALDDFNCLSFIFEKMLVDDARNIVQISSRKISDSEKTAVIIYTNTINIQAQNSMLKSLEEPTKNLLHIWITPNPNLLLETVLSRSIFVPTHEIEKTFGIKTFEKENQYLNKIKKMNLAERIKFAEEISTKIKDGEMSKKEAQKILQEIAIDLKNTPAQAKTILKLEGYLNDSSASVKSILEFSFLALK